MYMSQERLFLEQKSHSAVYQKGYFYIFPSAIYLPQNQIIAITVKLLVAWVWMAMLHM